MTKEENERLARLETEQEMILSILNDMRNDLRKLRTDWNKARGMVAGVILTLSALFSLIFAVIEVFRNHG
jgi:hypothetical protein